MFKSKSGIIALIIFFIISISMVFIKPQLEGTINNNSKIKSQTGIGTEIEIIF